ncbi:ABC transporter ATP-binding protein/permease [Prosthecochloris sp. SCSIO W1102]|uniref:ABC transporter ATP-binding protein n=1 Tax=Prosthecochloris sp. SCSIO W1102 TaxID=2992243 RepID=UPI00223D24E1|nr:ABC transporter ATP-binding protein [Prosthecochloris sp. SCSIO W1102]UZJ39126.1 ABC transporter ATP-binding protein/permease [Prosthecochloris sp. SCSIO W1102]
MNILIVRILRYLAPSRWKIVLVVFMSMLTSLFGVVSIYSVLPLLNAIFTADKTVVTPAVSGENAVMDNAVGSKEVEGASLIDTEKFQEQLTNTFQRIFHAETKQRTLLNICLFLMATFALKNLFLYINKQIIFRVQTKATKKLRDDVFHSIIEMHLDYFNQQRVGGLMNHVYNDVQSVQGSITTVFINFVQNPFTIFVYVGILFVLSWKLALFAFTVSFVIFLVIRVIGKRVKNLSRVFREKMGSMNSVLQEKFSGIKVIKSSGFEDVEVDRFKSFTNDFRRLDLRIYRLKNIISPLNETLLVAAVSLVLWFGGLQVFEGAMTANELIVFAFSLYSAMGPIKMLGEANTKIQGGMASAERLFEVIDAVPEVKNGTRSITGFSKSIRFEDVCFRYRKEPGASNVLDHVSFEIKKGEMVALVGQSGSGKSTAVDLLLRFYDVDSGCITIDGIDIREFDYKQLRRMIGVVSQEVILFNDTIEQNIAYGFRDTIDSVLVEQAARLANAHEFIEEKPLKYNTVVGDRGLKLSGGQRQRLAIARAMVKNPELLIFDEATSALDNESEKVVQGAIDHALEDRTALVVAHRLSTIKNADRIVVFSKGTVAEMGKHEELLAKDGLYKMYYDIQFSSSQVDA